ncbi:MAG: hypothetical protein ACKV2O_21825 [Acidimicrobiales bacterium]
MGPASEIDCIDCGGRCVLMSLEPELGWEVGHSVVYRCRDCHDRWDVVIDPEDLGLEPQADQER